MYLLHSKQLTRSSHIVPIACPGHTIYFHFVSFCSPLTSRKEVLLTQLSSSRRPLKPLVRSGIQIQQLLSLLSPLAQCEQ
jgi:5-methylcytosine-specific restriction endonuclease McrA